MSKLNQFGEEILDPTPMSVPVNFKRKPDINERIRAMVRSEQLRAYAESQGAETFDEAEDFDCGEEGEDFSSPWELEFDPGLGKEIPRQEKQILDQERSRFDGQVKKSKWKKWFGRDSARHKVQDEQENDERASKKSRQADRSDRSPSQRQEEPLMRYVMGEDSE